MALTTCSSPLSRSFHRLTVDQMNFLEMGKQELTDVTHQQVEWEGQAQV